MTPPSRRGRRRPTGRVAGPPLEIEGRRLVSGLAEFPGFLRRLGVEPGAVLRCAGLPPTALDDPQATISYAQVGALFGCAALATGIEHIGLHSGAGWRLDHLGMVGQLVRNSVNFGDAMQSAVLHHWLNGAGAVPFMFRSESVVEIGYALYATGVPHSDHVYDAALAAWITMIRELCGPGWSPSQVFLPRSRPDNTAPYQRLFAAPVTFNSDYAALRFPSALLAVPLPGADAARLAALGEALTAIGPEPIAPRSHRLVRIMLARGDTKAENLAATLSLSRRTLDRRLKAQDLSFQSVLDGVRYEAARQLLEISSVDISSIARALGYTEPSPFTRAFKRWSGQTPSEWRRSRKPSRRA
jgi:AraC-like DNA-binding protein